MDQVTEDRRELSSVREGAKRRELLGIRQAVALPAGADALLSPELPLYVPRDLHPTLATWIAAHAASGGLLVVSGLAKAGKSRCLFEALAAMVGDWPMFVPEDAAQLAAHLEATADGGPLVVWLDDLYYFLGPDGLKAATVRRLLAGKRPVLLVGTILREHYNAFAETGTQRSGNGARPDREAHEILTALAHRERLAAVFTQAELQHAATLAQRDPRIAAALAHSSRALAENLATTSVRTVPRKEQESDDPYRDAVLDAAVTARLCGHPPVIPVAVLEPLAVARLELRQPAAVGEDWFTSAATRACIPSPEVRVAALRPASTGPGKVKEYEVSSILVQRDRPPTSDYEWNAVVDNASADACRHIGKTALEAGKPVIAAKALRKAGDRRVVDRAPKMARSLGFELEKRGDIPGARAAYQIALDSGHSDEAPRAARNLGFLLEKQGDVAGACAAYRIAVDSGHRDEAPRAARNLGFLLAKQGDVKGAGAAFQLAVDSGHRDEAPKAARNLASLLEKEGDTSGARAAYQIAVDSGHPDQAPSAAVNLGFLLEKLGDMRGARIAYQLALDSGDATRVSYARRALQRLRSAGTAPPG